MLAVFAMLCVLSVLFLRAKSSAKIMPDSRPGMCVCVCPAFLSRACWRFGECVSQKLSFFFPRRRHIVSPLADACPLNFFPRTPSLTSVIVVAGSPVRTACDPGWSLFLHALLPRLPRAMLLSFHLPVSVRLCFPEKGIRRLPPTPVSLISPFRCSRSVPLY